MAIQIILTLAEALINSLPELLNAAIQIVVALVNGITQALPTLVPAIVNAVILARSPRWHSPTARVPLAGA